jgi:methylmalonyl-CoA mutase
VSNPFTKTAYDPYVNILRTATEAFSGVVGGVNALRVAPFDEPLGKPVSQSKRIARNISLMLKEEFDLRSPVDPAGCSWYVESLTNEIIDAVWEQFTAIESKGGLLKALLTGEAQAGIDKGLKTLYSRSATRALRIVGTNMYANATEKALSRDNKTTQPVSINVDPGLDIKTLEDMEKAFESGYNILSVYKAIGDKNGETCEKISPRRLSEPYENMRRAVEQKGGMKVFLANMGPVSQHKARADFSAGFFEVAGAEILNNTGFLTVDEAAEAAVNSGADVAVICSTDDTYPVLVPELCFAVAKRAPHMQLILAGMPAAEHKDSYFEAGLTDFIHIRSNCLETLINITQRKGE